MKYIKIKDHKTKCLECGTALYGRADKKFCCTTCKNMHNNRLRERNIEKRPYYSIIDRNYRILKMIINSGCAYISIDKLLEMGFNPNYVTGFKAGEKGHKEYSCYDVRYYQSSNKIFNIRKDSGANLQEKSPSEPDDMP